MRQNGRRAPPPRINTDLPIAFYDVEALPHVFDQLPRRNPRRNIHPGYEVRLEGPLNNPSAVAITQRPGNVPDNFDQFLAMANVMKQEIQSVLDRTTIGNSSLDTVRGYLTIRSLSTDKIKVLNDELPASDISGQFLEMLVERNFSYFLIL